MNARTMLPFLVLVSLVVLPAQAQLTVQSDGKVIVGTPALPNDLQVTGAVSGLGTLPVGAVIDWWKPYGSIEPVPEGFAICDGSQITDPESPYYTAFLPDLVDQFTRGVATPGDIGHSGGSDTATVTVGVNTSGKHTHGLPAQTGDVYNGGSDPGGATYKTRDDNQGWGSDVHLRVDDGSSTEEGQHYHALGGSTADDGDHTHSIYANPVSTVPSYVGLLKIMRIK